MRKLPDSIVRADLNRRGFLKTGLSATGAFAADQFLAARAANPRPVQHGDRPWIIDCHAHIYGEDESKYPPIAKPFRPRAGNGTVAHLRREMQAAGVERATAIQTSTFYQWDNRFIADAAKANRDVLAGVCTLDPDDPHSVGRLAQLAATSNIQGLRSIPARNGRLDDPGVDVLWTAAEHQGIVINAHIRREQRGELEALLVRHPHVRVVIDHCLYLNSGPECNAILADMQALARFPNVHAKLSCVVSGSAEKYPFRDMHGPCRQIIQAFGPDRCVWGSDFPCELWCPKATYTQHLRVFTHELGLDRETQRHVLGETARRLWFS